MSLLLVCVHLTLQHPPSQLLIVASGVDWAAKETLQELLLSLGEPLELP